MNIILFYDDRGRWWQPGNYLTKVIDSSSNINIYNHGVIPEDVGVLESLMPFMVDLILVVDSGKTHHKLHHHTRKIKESGAKTAIWLSDTHMDWIERKQWISEFNYDFVFVAQKNAIERVIQECGYAEDKVIWLPHAVDTDVFKIGEFKKKYSAASVCFMNENRKRLFPVLHSMCDFKQFATIWGWSVAKAYQEAKIGINFPVLNDPLNMRTFEIGALKVPQIISYPDNDPNGLFDLFENEKHFLAFENSNVEKLKEYVSRLLANPTIGEEMAQNMYDEVVEKHTYKHRLNTILKTMGFQEI